MSDNLLQFLQTIEPTEDDSLWENTKQEIYRITEMIKEPLQDSIEKLAKRYIDLYHTCQKAHHVIKELRKINEKSEQKQQQLLKQKQTLESLSREMQKKYRQVSSENKELQNSKDEELRKKFKSFLEEYHLREKHFQAVIKTKDHEYQLCQAKCEMYCEKSMQSMSRLDIVQKQVAQFTQTEQDLKKQLSVYVDKFKQVEETLNKSNELFVTFRKEMEQMSEKTKRLEEENRQAWTQHESLNENMEGVLAQVFLFNKRNLLEQQLKISEQNNKKLEKLCRALQAERQQLRKVFFY
jgi:chromosome segregation ATPase